MHTGPSLTPLLYTVMLRFRMYKIVLLADIKQAFLQIEVDPEDRDALRFLWVKNPKELNSPVLEYRFTRAIFGAGPSPYILGGTVRHHMEQYKAIDPEFVEDVNESLYVDDYVSGGDEKLEVCERKQKLQERFEAGGFTLRKWYTNEESIARKINDEPSNEERKVLGTIWDPGEDLLKINLAVPESQGPTTKRQLLSSLSAIYDPLGVAGPLVMKARVLFQKLCSQSKGWDDILSEEKEKIYQKWLSEMQRSEILELSKDGWCNTEGRL